MAARRKKTLEGKQIELKAKNQGIRVDLVPWQFTKGAKRLLKKKGIKQKAQEMLDTMMDSVVPDEWCINGLEPLAGKKMTITQAIMFRVMYDGITGAKSNGFKNAAELLNRVLGKVPLVVKHSEDGDDEFLELTDEELNREIQRLAESIRVKRLPVITGEVVSDVKS